MAIDNLDRVHHALSGAPARCHLHSAASSELPTPPTPLAGPSAGPIPTVQIDHRVLAPQIAAANLGKPESRARCERLRSRWLFGRDWLCLCFVLPAVASSAAYASLCGLCHETGKPRSWARGRVPGSWMAKRKMLGSWMVVVARAGCTRPGRQGVGGGQLDAAAGLIGFLRRLNDLFSVLTIASARLAGRDLTLVHSAPFISGAVAAAASPPAPVTTSPAARPGHDAAAVRRPAGPRPHGGGQPGLEVLGAGEGVAMELRSRAAGLSHATRRAEEAHPAHRLAGRPERLRRVPRLLASPAAVGARRRRPQQHLRELVRLQRQVLLREPADRAQLLLRRPLRRGRLFRHLGLRAIDQVAQPDTIE